MATPPYKVRADLKTTPYASHDLQVNGIWYKAVDLDDGSMKFANAQKVPDSAVTRIAHYMPSDAFAVVWLKGEHTPSNKGNLLFSYCDKVGPIKVTPGLPGGVVPNIGNGIAGAIDKFASWGDALKALIGYLTDPHTWVRIAEVLIGGALVAVGAAHLSGSANSILKATPIVGKVL